MAPEVARRTSSRGDYWKTVEQSYLNFRLDQAPDFVLGPGRPEPQRRRPRRAAPAQPAASSASPTSRFGGFGLILVLLASCRRPRREARPDLRLGDCRAARRRHRASAAAETTGIPLSDHIASRALHDEAQRERESATATTTATLTQLLLEDLDGRLGWLLSLRGAIDVRGGRRARRSGRSRSRSRSRRRDGLDALLHFTGDDKLPRSRARRRAAMSVAIEPAQPATAGPAFALPDATGTRLEIGDFTFKIEITKDGFKLKAAAKKSAFVIATGEADSFVKESLGKKETRVEFDFGVTATRTAISVDGGGRLSTTISLNTKLGPVTVQTIQLALEPEAKPRAPELRFSAVASFTSTSARCYITRRADRRHGRPRLDPRRRAAGRARS